MGAHTHPHDHDHDHDHGHGHDHAAAAHAPIDEASAYRPESLVLEEALRELLLEKEVFTADDIRRQIEDTESRNPGLGARVVARAWTDPVFRARLLADAKGAVTSLGIDVSNSPELKVVENAPGVHHVIVCTLCSCYPKVLLGVPPAWYKNPEYRSRTVAEPRAVLAEFGTTLPDDVEVRVVDSTADLRYMVLPERPAGTEAWSEDDLAAIVHRDAMIGVARVTHARS